MTQDKIEPSTFFNEYRNKTKDVHNYFSKMQPKNLFEQNDNYEKTLKTERRNELFDNMMSAKTRHTMNGDDNINKLSVFSIAEDESNNPLNGATPNESSQVYKKCSDSMFATVPNPSVYIAVEKPRLNLNDTTERGDQYPKTLIEDIIKNSHDSRNTRILSSQFEACVPVDVKNINEDQSPVFVSVIEDAEMKYLGRHPEQLHKTIQGFTLEKSFMAKSFIPLFLTTILLLLFSKK